MQRIPLTPREKQIIHLIAKGYNASEVASKLGIAQPTVHSHKNSIYRKLRVDGVTNQEQLIEYAEKEGLT